MNPVTKLDRLEVAKEQFADLIDSGILRSSPVVSAGRTSLGVLMIRATDHDSDAPLVFVDDVRDEVEIGEHLIGSTAEAVAWLRAVADVIEKATR